VAKRLLTLTAVWWLGTGGLVGQLRPGVPTGILDARLVSVAGQQLELVLEGGREMICQIDGRTYIDRERERLTAKDLKPGDYLELVTEWQGIGGSCFARMIHVVGMQRRFAGRGKVGQVRRSTESFAPRGSVTVTGMVRDLQEKMLELRTKQEGTMKFHVRPDTSFVRDGVEVGAGEVDRTQPVFVRAGYDFNGELEVYQVAWGAIVQPEKRLPRP